MIGPRRLVAKWGNVSARTRWNAGRAARAIRAAGPGRGVGDIDLGPTTSVWETSIRGWAAVRNDPVVAVLVVIDGRVHHARVGVPRPEVARALGGAPWTARAGWQLPIDLRPFEGGVVVVDAYAVTTAGLVHRLGRRRSTVVVTPLAHFLSPRDSVVRSDFVSVVGVVLADEPTVRVELFADGAPAGRARLHAMPTRDLEVSSLPWSGVAAFSATVDVRGIPDGSAVELTGSAIDLSGARRPVMPTSFTVARAAPASTDEETVVRLRRASSDLGGARATTPGEVRLVMATHDLGLGGGQLYLTELVRQLRARVDWPMLVISPRTGVLRAELEDAGVAVHCCGGYPLDDPVAYESKLLELAHVVRGFGGNIVLSNTMLAAIGADLASRLGAPSVVAIHESYEWDEFFAVGYPEGGVHPRVRDGLRDAVAASAAVVFEADSTRRLYEPVGDARRFVTVPYGISVAAIEEYVKATDRDELRRRHGLPVGSPVLLCMGTVEARKAQALLIAAFARVADRHREATLVIVGCRDDDYGRAVRRLAEQLDLGDRVRLVGMVQDTRPWYRMADLLVSASDLESMPRSIIESMAFGVPVVAADAFGVGELITHEESGWLFAPRDGDALERALDRVLTLPRSRWSEIAEEAARVVGHSHDSAGYGAAYEALLGALAVDPSRLPGPLLAAG